MEEDVESTLVFVDMLGFAALTEKYPNRLIHSSWEEQGFHSTSTSETSNQFWRFQRVLDSTLFQHSLIGNVQAMLFSDCAFLDFGKSLLAGLVTTELMRNFILAKVPVRMGIGRGTFYPLKFSTDLTGSTIIGRTLFFGTAVIRAHAAEQCGGKGLRIFVHPSVEPEFSHIRRRIRIMTLSDSYKNAKWELDFLHEQRPASEKPSAEEDDRNLFAAVVAMQDTTMPKRVRRQYSETIKAMNRMRIANSRPVITVRGGKLK